MVIHKKPTSFYEVFTRKGEGQKTTHYCPGCGHGNAHKLIAEAIDQLGVQDRVIFCSPVGCSVFAYYYFDTGNIQCSHGRAPAVATAIRRSRDDAVVISYQGDGDLAGIGMGAIIHAANRGENITVYFINNAIYGMTGGQMAPTTLLGQKTMTSPLGRTSGRDGNPIGMCELLNSLQAPVFIERVSFGSAAKIMKARKVIKMALQNQVEGKGFSFVEILSPCPVNWKMEPATARKWIVEKLEPVFPVGNFRDRKEAFYKNERLPFMNAREMKNLFSGESEDSGSRKKQPPKDFTDRQVKISGFGGQGVMSAGILLANCAIREGLNATWLPSYGPEMRGGTANASVILSSRQIGSPVVDRPNVLIAMNAPSLHAFEEKMKEGGLVFVNSSIVEEKVQRPDLEVYYVPVSDIAKEVGLIATANIVVLTLFFLASRVIDVKTLKEIIPLSIKKKEYLDVNLKALEAAIEYYNQNF